MHGGDREFEMARAAPAWSPRGRIPLAVSPPAHVPLVSSVQPFLSPRLPTPNTMHPCSLPARPAPPSVLWPRLYFLPFFFR